jgi:iron(III) transport system ATP-binding protein
MKSPSLEYQSVTRHYSRQEKAAISSVSLAVEENEILVLVGESGSGKTTLLRLAAGLELPDQGSVRISGEIVSDQETAIPPERRGVGMVFQDGALFPHLDAAGNISYGLKGWSKDEQDKRITFLLAMVGLGGKEHRFPHELSGGERQRLALARALAPQPKLILFDEPFSNLDPSLRRGLREEVRSILKKLNATAIFVTHDPADALAVADRIAILRGGKIEQTGTPPRIYREPANGYCARLFGPANAFPDQNGEMEWVRPERLRLHTEPAAEALPGRVERIHDSGRDREIHIRPEAAAEGAEDWIFFDNTDSPIQPGDKVWLSRTAR